MAPDDTLIADTAGENTNANAEYTVGGPLAGEPVPPAIFPERDLADRGITEDQQATAEAAAGIQGGRDALNPGAAERDAEADKASAKSEAAAKKS